MLTGTIVDGALALALLLALAAGLLSFLSPCVLPLVPGYFGYLGSTVASEPGRPNEGRGRLLLGVVLFIAGFTMVFVTVTILGGTLGVALVRFADPITRVLGILIVAMGLIFIGMLGNAQRTVRFRPSRRFGLLSAPILGLAVGVGWTPCIGPTLAAIMAVSWNLGDPLRAGILGLAYSLGLGIPFVLLAFGFGWAARAVAVVRRRIRAINLVGGSILVLLGLLMVSGVWTMLMSALQGVMLRVTLPI